MSLVVDLSMEDLPDNVMVEILSRLPVKTIIHCKCVCKKWLDLISHSYFVNLHMSRSPTVLLIHCTSEKELTRFHEAGILKLVEVKDELDHHNLNHDPVMSLDLSLTPIFQDTGIYPVGSVDSLLCLQLFGRMIGDTCICNPITREYMILPRPKYYRQASGIAVYCFGVSSLTQEYKVIRISQKYTEPDFTSTSEAEVYTLGTGQWRSLGHVPYWIYEWIGTFLKGHAHWVLDYRNHSESLCAFDFDKETFEFFPSPPNADGLEETFVESLGVLKGCLCLYDSYDSNFTVWVMKEYGIKTSWHKELVITRSVRLQLDLEPACVIDSFKDGSILMRCYGKKLIVYCPQRKTFVDTEICDGLLNGLAYRPSFHQLHNFKNEQIHMFYRWSTTEVL